jgi:DNA anti-recombination protein RmuC
MPEPTEAPGGGFEPIEPRIIEIRKGELLDPRDCERVEQLNNERERAEREGDWQTLERIDRMIDFRNDTDIINDPERLSRLDIRSLSELLDRAVERAGRARGKEGKRLENQAIIVNRARNIKIDERDAIESQLTQEQLIAKRQAEMDTEQERQALRERMHQAKEEGKIAKEYNKFADSMNELRKQADRTLDKSSKEFKDWINNRIPEMKELVKEGIQKTIETLAKATETAMQVFQTIASGIATVATLTAGTIGMFISSVFKNQAGT